MSTMLRFFPHSLPYIVTLQTAFGASNSVILPRHKVGQDEQTNLSTMRKDAPILAWRSGGVPCLDSFLMFARYLEALATFCAEPS